MTTADAKLRVAVLASGGGTNLQSIIDNSASGNLDVEIVLVLCNRPDAGALNRAAEASIPTLCLNHRDYPDRETYDRALVAALQQVETELVVLAGFMRIISQPFIEAFPDRIINIHPALLPAFPGLHVQRKALEHGVRFTGCTVHFVDGGVDTGPIIAQAVVPVLDDDDEASLSQRILVEEHRLYPYAIQLFAEQRLRIEGRRVRISPAADPEGQRQDRSGP